MYGSYLDSVWIGLVWGETKPESKIKNKKKKKKKKLLTLSLSHKRKDSNFMEYYQHIIKPDTSFCQLLDILMMKWISEWIQLLVFIYFTDIVLHFIIVFFLFITILGISLQEFVSVYCSVVLGIYLRIVSVFERMQEWMNE